MSNEKQQAIENLKQRFQNHLGKVGENGEQPHYISIHEKHSLDTKTNLSPAEQTLQNLFSQHSNLNYIAIFNRKAAPEVDRNEHEKIIYHFKKGGFKLLSLNFWGL